VGYSTFRIISVICTEYATISKANTYLNEDSLFELLLLVLREIPRRAVSCYGGPHKSSSVGT
jgi:hypothetical protein